jgi:hypothetical protein
MNEQTEELRQTIVGLADLIKEVRLHGMTARFNMLAPGLLEEARVVLRQSAGHQGAPNTLSA